MKNRYIKFAVVCLGLMVAAVLVYWFFIFKYPMVSGIRDFKILSQTDSVLVVQVCAEVSNKSIVGATVHSAKADIFIDDVFLGKGTTSESFTVKGHDTTTVCLQLRLPPERFAKLLADMTSKPTVMVRANGTFDVGLVVMDVPLTVSSETRLNTSEEIQRFLKTWLNDNAFKIKQIRLKSMSLSESRLLIDAEMRNRLGMDFELRAMHLDLYMGGSPISFGEWVMEQPRFIAKDSTAVIQAEAAVKNFASAGQMALAMLGKKTARAKGTARIFLAGKEIEAMVDQEVPLSTLVGGQ